MIEILLFLSLITAGYFFGSAREKKHLESLKERERIYNLIVVRPNKTLSPGAKETQMISATVVVANDYFKTVLAGLQSLFGARMSGQEMLLDRARREAILRLKEKAQSFGAREIAGLRMTTSLVDQTGVEVMVYGTAIR